MSTLDTIKLNLIDYYILIENFSQNKTTRFLWIERVDKCY